MSHKKWHRHSNRWQDKPWWLRQLRRYVRKDLELDEVLAREREQGERPAPSSPGGGGPGCGHRLMPQGSRDE